MEVFPYSSDILITITAMTKIRKYTGTQTVRIASVLYWLDLNYVVNYSLKLIKKILLFSPTPIGSSKSVYSVSIYAAYTRTHTHKQTDLFS